MKQLYLTLSEISRMFDSPNECCEDYKVGAYVSDQEGKDILKRRCRYGFKVRVFQIGTTGNSRFLGEVDPIDHVSIPETEELPMLGFTHDARPIKKGIMESVESIGNNESLDWTGIFQKDYKGNRLVKKQIVIMRNPGDDLLGYIEVNISVR